MTVPDGLLGLELDTPERALGLGARLLGGELTRGLDGAPARGLDGELARGLEGLGLARGEGFDSRC